jgi:hypothetical protein
MQQKGISTAIFDEWATTTQYCKDHLSSCEYNNDDGTDDDNMFDENTFSTAGEKEKFTELLNSVGDKYFDTTELVEDILQSLYDFISKRYKLDYLPDCPIAGYASFMNVSLWKQALTISPSFHRALQGDDGEVGVEEADDDDDVYYGDDDDGFYYADDDGGDKDDTTDDVPDVVDPELGKFGALFTTEYIYIDTMRFNELNTVPLTAVKDSISNVLRYKDTKKKADKNFKMKPPVALSPGYQTCVKVGTSAIVQALGLAFSNAQLLSSFVLMISTIFAVKFINRKLMHTDPLRTILSPKHKSNSNQLRILCVISPQLLQSSQHSSFCTLLMLR